MTETPAEKYRRIADECRRKAEKAASSADKHAWLELAEDWSKLSRGEELHQEWQMNR